MKKPYGPQRPVINDKAAREDAIKKNLPARFEIKVNPRIDYGSSFWDDVRTFDFYGRKVVQNNDHRIRRYAHHHKIDPDLVRAVMFAESARGHKVIFNWLGDVVKKSNSIRPMNIQKDSWASLIDKNPEDMYDPDVNIEAGVVLLRRLRERIEEPTPEKVGTLWNDLREKKTTIFGTYIGKLYQEKPWKRFD